MATKISAPVRRLLRAIAAGESHRVSQATYEAAVSAGLASYEGAAGWCLTPAGVAAVSPREPLPSEWGDSPFGFFGTMAGLIAEHHKLADRAAAAPMTEVIYSAMSRRLLGDFPALSPENVREFLDSRTGRHLADAVGLQDPAAAIVPWLVSEVASYFGREVVPQAERHASVNFRCAGPLPAAVLEAKIADALRRAGLQVTAIEIDKEG